jgi:hypothetical protein
VLMLLNGSFGIAFSASVVHKPSLFGVAVLYAAGALSDLRCGPPLRLSLISWTRKPSSAPRLSISGKR